MTDHAGPLIAQLHVWQDDQNPLVRAFSEPLVEMVTNALTQMQEVYRPRLLGHKVGVLARRCRRAMLRSFEAPHSRSCLRRRGRPRDGPGTAGG